MTKKFIFYLVMFAFVFLVLEAFAWLVSTLKDRDDLYDHRASVLQALDKNELSRFLEKSGDPVLGWTQRGAKNEPGQNCNGETVEYSFDTTGARLYTGYNPDAVQVVIAGDSYTKGEEAGDDATYPAQLAQILGVAVANHGVGGYGPTQSFLNLQQKLALYPNARVAVLGIMYENLYRMVNSYRPVLYANASRYGLKPYMAGGRIMPHPGLDVLQDIELFRKHANSAFDQDFWAKPKYTFPYSVSLTRALGSRFFRFTRLQKNFRKWGLPEYRLAFQSEAFLSELFSLLEEFTVYAKRMNVQPMVVFIPRNGFDTDSVSELIETHGTRFPDDLVIGDVGSVEGIDWNIFNLVEADGGDTCHPSTYGNRKIAEYIAGLLDDQGHDD